MRRSTGLTRLLWRITALLQLMVPTVTSIADARLERDAASPRADSHIESTTSKDCVRVHTSDCALCQHLTTPLARSQKPAPPAGARHDERPAVLFRVAWDATPTAQPSLPRAPPAA
jgi:hypothetical protein